MCGPIKDVGTVHQFFTKRAGINVERVFADIKDTECKQIKVAIQTLFDDPNSMYKVLFYSGHGQKETGNWCFEPKDGTFEWITPADIEQMWMKRKSAGKQALFIISDSCYSGL